MKIVIALSFDVPDPEAVPEILTKIDPPNLPHSDGQARVVVPPYSRQLLAWLDEK